MPDKDKLRVSVVISKALIEKLVLQHLQEHILMEDAKMSFKINVMGGTGYMSELHVAAQTYTDVKMSEIKKLQEQGIRVEF